MWVRTMILRHSVPLALAAVCLVTGAVGAAPVIDSSALFTSGQGGYHTYRIPAIVRTKSGALLAFCEGRKSSSSDTGDIDTLVRRSTDNGETWSAAQVVWSDGSNTCGNPAPVADLVTGKVHLLSTWNLGTDSESMIVNGTSTNTRRVFLTTSDDDGLVWGAPSEITATAKQAGWSWYATGPGAGIQLSRGTQAGRLVVACDHIRTDNKAFGSHVIFSDNGGAGWQIGAVAVTTASVRPNENLAVELVAPAAGGGSKLFFNARDHQGPSARATTFSEDGGLSYTPADFTDAPQFTCPTVQGGLARFRATDAGDSSNRILFSCPYGSSRNRMAIWSSADEAVTWSSPKTVHEGPSAYSDMTRLSDGRMALLFEKGASSAYETITLTRFNEEWLDEPAPPAENPGAAFWNFEEVAIGQTVPLTAGSIRDIHPDGRNLHLTAAAAFPVLAGAPGFGNGRAIGITGNGGARILDTDSANRFDFGASDSFTVEIVCRIPSGSTQVGALVAKDLATLSPSWWLRVEAGKARFLVADTTAEPNISSTAAINTGQWVHVAAVRDATVPASKQLRVYVNGVLSGSTTDTTTGSLANGQAVWIGRYNAGTRLLTGDVDMVRITPSVLQPAAFLATYDQFDADRDAIPDDFERAAAGGTAALGTGDSDRDGRPDLLEYVFGTDPAGSDPAGQTLILAADRVEIRSRQRQRPAWLGLELLSSTDLVAWESVPSTVTLEPLGGDLHLRVDTVEFPTGEPARLFFRHRVINGR